VVGRLEVGNLEAKVLCAEIFLRAERHRDGLLERVVGIAYLQWGRQVALVMAVF
jgi:hypothetical protein